MPWRRCQILIFLTNFLGIIFFKDNTFPMKTSRVGSSNPTKFMHDASIHHQTLHAWLQFQNLCLTYRSCLGGKDTLLGDKGGCDVGPPFVDCNFLMLDRPHESNFLIGLDWLPNLWPIELVFPQKVALPFVPIKFPKFGGHYSSIGPLGRHGLG